MNDIKTWDSVEARLNALTSPDSQSGLSFVRQLFARLGDPYAFPAIHIAGTNGKGSTAADIDAILRAQGYKTALYTSPHLLNIGERLRINGEPLPPSRWNAAFDRVENAMRAVPDGKFGYFQIVTAACFLMITEENVDAAVIETGLGGRLDATNVLPRPLISVIVPLGIDHTHILGTTLKEIAAHKFDIIKPGCPALYAGGAEEQNRQFAAKCAEVGAHGEILSETVKLSDVRPGIDGSFFRICSPVGESERFIRLAGLHQPENAALALRALELLNGVLPVSDAAVAEGLASVSWPGRMEVLRRDPDIIIDGAHNPHGAAALARSLKAIYGDRELHFVCASMSDKDYAESLKIYAESFPNARIWCTQIDAHRCESAEKLAETAACCFRLPPSVERDPLAAIRAASAGGVPTIICGSLYLIAVIKEQVMINEL